MSPHWSDIAGNEDRHLNSSSLELSSSQRDSSSCLLCPLVWNLSFQIQCILITFDFQVFRSFLLQGEMIIKTSHCEPKQCIGLEDLWDWLYQMAQYISKTKKQPKQTKTTNRCIMVRDFLLFNLRTNVCIRWLALLPRGNFGRDNMKGYLVLD